MPSESQGAERAIILGTVAHSIAPSGPPAPRTPRRTTETAQSFARRVRLGHGLEVESLPVSTVETMAAAGAQMIATRAGVVVYRCRDMGRDTRDSSQVEAGVPFEAICENTEGALAAFTAELAAEGQADAVRRAAKVAEALARAAIDRPGALAALEAGDTLTLGRLLPGVVLYTRGEARRVFVSTAAKALGGKSGRCALSDVFRAVGRINGIGGQQ